MAQTPTSFRGPFAIFMSEGDVSARGEDPSQSYRALMPPSTDPLLVVDGVDVGAYEACEREGRGTAAVPRLVASHEALGAFPYMPGVRLSEIAAQSRELDGTIATEVAVYVVAEVARARAALRGYAQQLPITTSNVRVGFDGALQLFVQREYDANFDTIIGVINHEPLWEPRTLAHESTLLPEHALPDLAAHGDGDARADVFVLASMLHFLLEGAHPFAAESLQATLERLRSGKPNSLTRAAAPKALSAALNVALARDPRERYGGAATFADVISDAVDVTGARAALAGLASSLFPETRAEQRMFVEEAGVASLDGTLEISPFGWVDDRRVVIALHELAGRPLWVDERLVTNAELAAWLKRAPVRPEPNLDHSVWSLPALAAEPAVVVSPRVAAAYAASEGGRIATEAEWNFFAAAGVRDLTRVWEWTSTPAKKGGFIVRGGPWRNRTDPGRVDNRSYEDVAAPDVGFRIVYESEPRTAFIASSPRRRR